MSTTFPTNLDTFTNPVGGDYQDAVPHASQHADVNDAIEALEAKVGKDGSAVTSSLDYKIANAVTMAQVFAAMYPVGSVYTNAAVSTNPATLLGFGTWSSIGDGMVMVNYKTGDSDFGTLAATGGAKTVSHTHSTPNHGHTVNDHSHTVDSHAHSVDQGNLHNGNYNPGTAPGLSGSDTGTPGTFATGNTAPGTSGASNRGTDSSGGSTSGGASDTNNLQPFVVVYIWKRTA